MSNRININDKIKFQYIKLKLTDRCNLDCLMCDIPRKRLHREMTTDEMKRLIDEVLKLGGKRVHTTGGEPTVRQDLFELARYTTRRNLEFDIQTNGVLITKTYAKKLAEAGVRQAAVTLQGPKEIDEKIRGKGTFDKTINAIKYLQNNAIRVSIAAALIKQNYRYLSDLVKIAQSLGVKSIRFQPYFTSVLFIKDKTVPMLRVSEIQELKPEIGRVINMARLYGVNVGNKGFLRAVPKYFLENFKVYPDPDCAAPFKCCVIRSNGDVFPCWTMSDPTEIYKIGNVLETPLSDLWFSDKFNKMRQLIKKGKCPGCLLACYKS